MRLAEKEIKIAAVMTLPRVSWSDSWGCVYNVCSSFGFPVFTTPGVFWHACFQNLFEGRVEAGCDWILTIDYDSMFTRHHVGRLIERVIANPHIDALAALQCRRGTEETPLMGIKSKKAGDRVELTNEPLAVDTAHFGLTMVSCEKLRRLPKPWFQGLPDSQGSWEGDDRTDADIYFWRKWRDAGFTVCVDPDVSIGHLQLMVSEFDEHGRPKHSHVEFWKSRQ
jgi:hypothetical protein